jgi:hypothetical protein
VQAPRGVGLSARWQSLTGTALIPDSVTALAFFLDAFVSDLTSRCVCWPRLCRLNGSLDGLSSNRSIPGYYNHCIPQKAAETMADTTAPANVPPPVTNGTFPTNNAAGETVAAIAEAGNISAGRSDPQRVHPLLIVSPRRNCTIRPTDSPLGSPSTGEVSQYA